MKETEERGKDKEMGTGYTGFKCGYRKWLVEGVSVLPKISHTHHKKGGFCLVLSSLAFLRAYLQGFFFFSMACRGV